VATTADVQKALNCSAPTARAILETLEKLGLGEFVNPGPPSVGTLTIAESLRWLLEEKSPKRSRADLSPEELEELTERVRAARLEQIEREDAERRERDRQLYAEEAAP
jgi:DNA-binding Lrp family transcriptional regulator